MEYWLLDNLTTLSYDYLTTSDYLDNLFVQLLLVLDAFEKFLITKTVTRIQNKAYLDIKYFGLQKASNKSTMYKISSKR